MGNFLSWGKRKPCDSPGVSGSRALQRPVVTNAVFELVALARLSVFAFTSAVNPVNLAARLGNHQRVAVVRNFDVGVAQKNVGGFADGVNPGGRVDGANLGGFNRLRELNLIESQMIQTRNLIARRPNWSAVERLAAELPDSFQSVSFDPINFSSVRSGERLESTMSSTCR
jgi:hypothetical protein